MLSNVRQYLISNEGFSFVITLKQTKVYVTESTMRNLLMLQLHGHTKVSVLNGGLDKWLSLGYRTTTEVSEVKVKLRCRNDELSQKYSAN